MSPLLAKRRVWSVRLALLLLAAAVGITTLRTQDYPDTSPNRAWKPSAKRAVAIRAELTRVP